jgi:hypothetical protein
MIDYILSDKRDALVVFFLNMIFRSRLLQNNDLPSNIDKCIIAEYRPIFKILYQDILSVRFLQGFY